ncbi:MAG: amino acid adenylation domain-containing protein, partial [Cyanobacteria bacterium J06588_5]
MSNIQDLYELSPTQQGMLFHTLYAPETGIYFEQRHCLLEGALDQRAFVQAWQQVVNRYDVLRSEFHWEETDKPLQAVYDTVELPWIIEDWQGLGSDQQNEKLNSFLVADRIKGFQLDQAPLMRCALFQLSEQQYRFVWSHHHLLMDGWCNGVLIKEVLTIYQSLQGASLEGKAYPLAPVRPYRDYISWLQQQDEAKAETYWSDALKGVESPTPLVIDRLPIDKHKQQIGATSDHSEQQVMLSAKLTKELQAFSQRSRLTLNTLLQGTWAIILSHYSGLNDLLFGVTVSGRPPELSGVESMVGLFINTVPLRAQLSETDMLLPWLQQLQQAQRDRETYSYSALTDIQTWSDLPSGLSLFESLLIFENYPVSIEAATQGLDTGLSLRDKQGYEQTNYPLTLVVIPGDHMQLSLRYDAQRFSESAIARLLGHLQTVLESFIESPEQSLVQVPLLTPSEQEILHSFSQGEQCEVVADCVHQQIETRAAMGPEAIAITFTTGSKKAANGSRLDSTLTYQQLNQSANKIAHGLVQKGVQKGTRVGLCLNRSVDMVASLLGILKVGASYIPLDPTHPAQRLSHIAEDANIELLITTADAATALEIESLSTFYLDKEASLIDKQSSENLSISVSPDDIAYILYTSGSTGKPKGVPIRHSSLINFLGSMAKAPGITEKDTLLAVTTLGFDIAALEIFLPLVSGAQLVITPHEVTLDGEQLAAVVADHRVTIMQATPATWRLLLNAGWAGSTELKILCGGEALEVGLAERLFHCGEELWNLYGPTETTIWSGALKVDREILGQGNIPIGLPIANTQFYVLDEQYRQVPVGIAGELYIGGLGLSPGYLNREDLTAERFVELLGFGGSTQPMILYKTGDRVRYRENGTLDFLGRLDNQIKLRGFRIELGEIEARLAQHPDIAQAVALVTNGENPQLVAYLTLTNEAIASEASQLGNELCQQLNTWVGQQLPTYMVPTGYKVIETFPLTPNGKVDRRALPPFEQSHTLTQPPQTPQEKLVAGIWATVLGIDGINLNDNFFELGGHSLLATRVIAQVRQVFETEVPLRSLFEHPVLSSFTAHIEQIQTQSQQLPNISRTEQLILSYAQQRQWLIAQLAPESSAYNIPIAIRLTGELSVESLNASIAQVVARHDTLKTAYPAVDGVASPVILTAKESPLVCPERSRRGRGRGGSSISPAAQQLHFALQIDDLTDLPQQEQRAEVSKSIQQLSQKPFDLVEGPLWRSQLLRLGDREHVLIFTFHHIIIDGWSIDILLKELTALYQAHQTGENLEHVLPSLPIRYRDYAAWQQSLDLSSQLTYWKKQLSGIAPLLELPTDFPRPAEPSAAGASYEFRLSQTEIAALQRFSQQNGVTLFMTLLTTLKVLLYRYSGIRDLAIGTSIANRQQASLEGIIGLFVNTLVIRTQLNNNPRFIDLLIQVRSTTLAAYSHQDLPFEQLIDALDIPRSQSHAPLVQVMLALQSDGLHEVSLPDLSFSPIAVESTTAKFDLTLDIRETERGLFGRWEYRTDLFNAETIHRLAGHFRTLLKAIPEHSELRISELPMLSRHELQQLQGWQQDTSAVSLPQESIHQLFEAQVNKAPEAIALSQNQTKITYQALNQKANQLARYLHQQGVRLETPVGIWATRTHSTITAILAILKAGGTYIPLDPTYPLERLSWIVQDTQMALLIADSPDVPVPSLLQAIVPIVELNERAAEISALSKANLSDAISPEKSQKASSTSLAYILYTSGSTGRPKGVCTPHQGVTRLVSSPNYVTLTADDVLLQAAPLTFDASTFEVWGALLNGGKLVLLSAQSPSLEALGEIISSERITTLWLTSGLFNLMVDEQLEQMTSVRQLLAGGDVLSISHLQKALGTLKTTRIINGYGPTEGTTFTCCHTITATDLDSTVPIGYPLPHTHTYVLDEDLQRVPAGIPGELYVGGAGVARGYLNQPALTAERFIPNPFYDVRQASEADSFYLYKTGDRVRYRADGALEYLGRIDQQVKIRGFRIEPGEIEAVLENHPAVQQVAVVVHGEGAEEKRLVAYLEPREATSSPLEATKQLEMRQFLLAHLPDYMVPAKFIWVEGMPLTPNGKIDRKALPAPQWNIQNEDPTLPQTTVEKVLVEIFSTCLPADSVGIHDNFFELGGDSILAMQIVSRAAQAGLTIEPKQIFQHQTVAELAAIAQHETQQSINQAPATGSVPLTPIQQWFFEQNLADPSHFNQSVCLALPDGFSVEA